MLFSNGNKAAGNKQNTIVAIVAIVLILGAGFMVARNFMGSSTPSPTGPEGMPSMPMGPGGPPSAPGIPGAPGAPSSGQSGAPVGPPGTPAPAATSAPATPAAPPAAAPSAAPSPAPAPPSPSPAAPAGPGAAKPAVKAVATKSMKVFSSVTINYPEKWKVGIAPGNTAAIFTDGSATFEVHSPNPKATSAQAIAQSAMKSLVAGGSVISSGAGKAGGQDTYWYQVSRGGQRVRVVGVDGPTRIVLLEHAPASRFAGYAGVFSQLEEKIMFSK